jgi:nitrile hydratase accessory protein
MSDPRATLAEIAAHCREGLPLPSQDMDTPVFSEPWQAQAFAMTVHLHAQGLFTWPEWAAALTAQLKGVSGDDGSTYYLHWLDALEQMVLRKQVGTPDQLHALEHAWEAAAERTPHGQPIELLPQDFRHAS